MSVAQILLKHAHILSLFFLYNSLTVLLRIGSRCAIKALLVVGKKSHPTKRPQ